MKKKFKIPRKRILWGLISLILLYSLYIIREKYVIEHDKKFYMSLCKDPIKLDSFKGKELAYIIDYLGHPHGRNKSEHYVYYNEQHPKLLVYTRHDVVVRLKCTY